MQEMSSSLRSRTFCCADTGRFRKSLKIKISGKTAGDLPQGEGKARTFSSNSVKKHSGNSFKNYLLFFIDYCLFFINNRLFFIDYHLFSINYLLFFIDGHPYSLLIIIYSLSLSFILFCKFNHPLVSVK
jgi:hypothetical protein